MQPIESALTLHRQNNKLAIPGSKRINHLEENIASENVKLTQADLQRIEKIMPAEVVSGTRYPERFMNALNR